MLDRMGVQDQASYMAAAHRDSLALDSVFVSPQLVTQLSAVVEEAMAAGQWTDALANLPTAVQPKDAGSLLSKAFLDHSKGMSWYKFWAAIFMHFQAAYFEVIP